MAAIIDYIKSDLKTPGKRRNRYFIIAGAAILLVAGYYAFFLLIDPRVLPQQAVHLLQDAVIPQQGQKVIVFSPHPDDETIATGGYIAQAIQQGAEVRIVLVTNGNKHGNEATRYAEFKKATAILGVNPDDLVFMGLPDGGLSELSETNLSQQLKQQTDNFSPDFIIYPAQQDFHPDNAAVAKAINRFVGSYSSIIYYRYLVHYGVYYPHPKKLAPTLYLTPPTRLVRFGYSWNKVMLPPAIEQLKQQAIYSYQSQFTNAMLKDLLLSSIRQNELLLAQ